MENPNTWTRAHDVLRCAFMEWERDARNGFYGPSLVDALVSALATHECLSAKAHDLIVSSL